VVAVRILLTVLTLALAAVASPSSASPDPIQTHCVADETGTAHCSTTVAGTCSVSSVGGAPSDVSCSVAAAALPVTCSLGPTTPGGDTDCRATYGQCYVHTHLYDREDALNQYEADCSGCGIHYGAGPLLTTGCYIGPPPFELGSAAVADPTQVCVSGFAQTWCDVSAGPCDVRVTPWTAWGDQYVVADCRTGGAGPTCHTEVHTQDPTNPEHWCAF
jgi:hypothetical protein